jgi:hypothetical protein
MQRATLERPPEHHVRILAPALALAALTLPFPAGFPSHNFAALHMSLCGGNLLSDRSITTFDPKQSFPVVHCP